MDFNIDMRRITPDFKLTGIEAKNIGEAQAHIISLISVYTAIDPYRYKIIPIEMNGQVRAFRIVYRRKSYQIRIYPSEKEC